MRVLLQVLVATTCAGRPAERFATETHHLASVAITSGCGSVVRVTARCGERLDSGPSAQPTDTASTPAS
ncbi:hypothetical protein AAW14_21335 [Streptomyces hygroscopicus]|nr:hypothetical protein [Streptomyces hygroscopicus]